MFSLTDRTFTRIMTHFNAVMIGVTITLNNGHLDGTVIVVTLFLVIWFYLLSLTY